MSWPYSVASDRQTEALPSVFFSLFFVVCNHHKLSKYLGRNLNLGYRLSHHCFNGLCLSRNITLATAVKLWAQHRTCSSRYILYLNNIILYSTNFIRQGEH